jgi:hypothetical protein
MQYERFASKLHNTARNTHQNDQIIIRKSDTVAPIRQQKVLKLRAAFRQFSCEPEHFHQKSQTTENKRPLIISEKYLFFRHGDNDRCVAPWGDEQFTQWLPGRALSTAITRLVKANREKQKLSLLSAGN